MSLRTLELRPRVEQTTFNLRRWAEILADPEMAKVQGRIETDRHDAGAQEVWVCGTFGAMSFLGPGLAPLRASGLCPAFPAQVEVR